MALTHWQTKSGLVVAEQTADEAAIGRALRRFDPRLALQFRPPYYVVVCAVNDHYAPVVATWMDLNGKPLPLSSGLLEKVQMWHVGSRNRPETVDEFNTRRQQELARDRDRDMAAVRADHQPYIARGRVQVSVTDTKRPLRRKYAPPKSGAPR